MSWNIHTTHTALMPFISTSDLQWLWIESFPKEVEKSWHKLQCRALESVKRFVTLNWWQIYKLLYLQKCVWGCESVWPQILPKAFSFWVGKLVTYCSLPAIEGNYVFRSHPHLLSSSLTILPKISPWPGYTKWVLCCLLQYALA